MSQERKALDSVALSLMLLLTALWGFQQVTVKVIATDVSLVMQAAIRSGLATVLLLGWASPSRATSPGSGCSRATSPRA